LGFHDVTLPVLADRCPSDRRSSKRGVDMTTNAGRVIGDLAMALLLVLLAPVAMILIGTPVVLFVRLLIEIGGRL